jgi:hypothetical protein
MKKISILKNSVLSLLLFCGVANAGPSCLVGQRNKNLELAKCYDSHVRTWQSHLSLYYAKVYIGNCNSTKSVPVYTRQILKAIDKAGLKLSCY